MPKTFSDNEREYIKNTLKTEAGKCLKIFGIKKTTIEELVKRANIPKGTFYLFYPSKEMLFLEVFNDFHDDLHDEIIKHSESISCETTVDMLTDIFTEIYRKVDESGFSELLIDGEIDALMRKLPDNVVNEHLSRDDLSFTKFISALPIASSKNISAFSGAFRAIFLSIKFKRKIGYECFDDSIKLLIKGLIIQLLEEDCNDKS